MYAKIYSELYTHLPIKQLQQITQISYEFLSNNPYLKILQKIAFIEVFQTKKKEKRKKRYIVRNYFISYQNFKVSNILKQHLILIYLCNSSLIISSNFIDWMFAEKC